MSLYDYHASLRLEETDPPFYALIMAAMRKADSNNIVILRDAWPEIYDEFQAPSGFLPGEEGDAIMSSL